MALLPAAGGNDGGGERSWISCPEIQINFNCNKGKKERKTLVVFLFELEHLQDPIQAVVEITYPGQNLAGSSD